MELFFFFGIAYLLSFIFIRKKSSTDESSVLDKKTSLFIKGILCIFVMLHNLGLDYLAYKYNDVNEGLIWVIKSVTESTGGIAVGGFFFLSAFGLLVSYKKHGNEFLKKLLTKNFIKLYLVAVGINIIEYFCFFRGAFDTQDTILRIFNFDLFNNYNRINRHGWFIATLLALYIIFSLIYFILSKVKTEKKIQIATFIVIGVVLTWKLLTIILDNGGMYSRELSCFAIGLAYGLYYEKINNFTKKYFVPCIIIPVLGYIIGVLFCEPVAAWSFCILIVTINQKFTMRNSLVEKLGSICLGIYLFLHFSTLVLNSYFINNGWLWIIMNALFILALSIALEIIIYVIKVIGLKIKKLFENRIKTNNDQKNTNGDLQ